MDRKPIKKTIHFYKVEFYFTLLKKSRNRQAKTNMTALFTKSSAMQIPSNPLTHHPKNLVLVFTRQDSSNWIIGNGWTNNGLIRLHNASAYIPLASI